MAAILSLYDWQQNVFDACENPDVEQIAVLGSRGPGKTWTCQHVNIARALQYPNTNHIIFRRTSDDIVKQYAPALKQVLGNFGGCRIAYTYNQTYKIFTIACPNGGYSRIYLAFAEAIKHAEKYQGFEYMTLSFDESTHFQEEIPKRIGSSVRGDKRVKKLYFGNPGGVGHGWNKRWFIDPKTRLPKTVVFRPHLRDNFELAEKDPGYAARLAEGLGGDEVLRKRWMDGDWDIVEGAYFVVPPGAVCYVQPPQWADWWCGVDWGFYPSAFACVWVATWRDPMSGRHRAHVYADLKRYKLTDPDQARAALEMEALLPVDKPRIRYADPSTRKDLPGENDEQTKSTLRVWAKYGFHCIGAKRYGRVPGWQLLRQFLAPIQGYAANADLPHGVLTISPNCMALLEELQNATHEENSDDMAGPDHCLVPGTLISTERGEVPIEEVRVGDNVWTRGGLRPVLRAWETSSDAQIYRVILANKAILEGTGNHPVFVVGKGFIRLDALRYNDSVLTLSIGDEPWKNLSQSDALFTEKLKKSNTTESSSDVIPTAQTLTVETITRQTEFTVKLEWVDCMKKSGRHIMGLFQKDFISTIRTSIHSITRSKISNVCRLQNIVVNTRMQNVVNANAPMLMQFDLWPRNGMEVQRGLNGTGSTAKMRGQIASRPPLNVNNAVKRLKASSHTMFASAPTTVNRNGDDKPNRMMKIVCAWFATIFFELTSIRASKPALENVALCLRSESLQSHFPSIRSLVSNVEPNTSPLMLAPVSAQTLAQRHGIAPMAITSKIDAVPFVEIRSTPVNTSRPKLVPVPVQHISAIGTSPVWNLTVGGEPEYFANGILVHNCLDSLRYLLTMVYDMRFPEPAQNAFELR